MRMRGPEPSSWSARQTTSPCTPGSSRSRTTTSYATSLALSSAASPSWVTSTARALRRRPRAITAASATSSSASSTRIALVALCRDERLLAAPAPRRERDDAREHREDREGDQPIDGGDDETHGGGKPDDGREQRRDAFARAEARGQET